MNEWLDKLQEIGLLFFGRDSAAEMWALIVVCALVVFFVYNKISIGFAGKGNGSVFVLIPGFVLLALTAVAVQLYWTDDWVFQLAAVAGSFFLLVLPLTKMIEKTSYLSALMVWTVCGLLLGAILLLERPLVQSFQRGIEKGSLMKNHRDQVNSLGK